jgi:hypothetical protein
MPRDGFQPATRDEAHKLHRAGLPITLCPPGTKKPLGKGWSATSVGVEWQHKRWTLREINKAFKVRGELNVGVLFGKASGLIDIEQDCEADAAAFAKVFEGCPPPVCPSFRSKRGVHRLYQYTDDLDATNKAVVHFDGLEIRIGANGKGAHSAFPPSVTGGVAREWLIPLDDCPAPPLPELVRQRILAAARTKIAAGGGGHGEGSGVEHREHRLLESTVYSEFSAPSVSSVCQAPDTVPSTTTGRFARDAINVTLPSGPGQRHRALFLFARHLKALPNLRDADADAVRPYVELWHRLALRTITTKAWEETWYDFRNAWANVRFAVGEEPIRAMFQTAVEKKLPVCAQRYEQEPLKRLVALCRELQDASGSAPFYLAGRTAAELIGVEHKTAARWLKMLCLDGVLTLVRMGTRHKASEYRYVGGAQ